MIYIYKMKEERKMERYLRIQFWIGYNLSLSSLKNNYNYFKYKIYLKSTSFCSQLIVDNALNGSC